MNLYKYSMMEAFSRAAAKPERSSGNYFFEAGTDFVEAILREREDLREKIEKSEVTYPEQGCFGYTVFIGDEVFKCPKKGAPDGFDREPEFLKQLEGKGLPVPKVTCVGKEFIFYGMKRMPGVELDSVFDILTQDEQRNLAKDIVNFIISMALALPSQDGKYAHHEDISLANVLVDPETKRLAAIIDFGATEYLAKDNLAECGCKVIINEMVKQEFNRRKAEIPDATPVPAEASAPSTRLWRGAALKNKIHAIF